MKTFKTVEELIEFVRDNENVATLENGEITLKDWIELGNSVEKHHKNYSIAVEEKKKSNSQKKELEQKIAEMTEQLDTVNNELAGLKAVQTGGEKEELQKLNKEKSEWIAKCNASESKVKDLEKQVLVIQDLERQVESYKEASNRAIILEAVRKAAIQRNVPSHIVDDSDFERIVVDDFIIDENGNIFTKGSSPKSVDNYIVAKQKEKIHWTKPTTVVGNEPMRAISDGGTIPDSQMALAGLFAQ